MTLPKGQALAGAHIPALVPLRENRGAAAERLDATTLRAVRRASITGPAAMGTGGRGTRGRRSTGRGPAASRGKRMLQARSDQPVRVWLVSHATSSPSMEPFRSAAWRQIVGREYSYVPCGRLVRCAVNAHGHDAVRSDEHPRWGELKGGAYPLSGIGAAVEPRGGPAGGTSLTSQTNAPSAADIRAKPTRPLTLRPTRP
jgi:hypothetical protein